MFDKLAKFLTKNKKLVILISVFAFIILIGVSSLLLIEDRAKTAEIRVYVAPAEAVVTVGGVRRGTMESFKIEPGEYEVQISAEGFKEKRGKVSAVSGETAELKVYLEPEAGNEKYYEEHPGDGLIVGEIKAAETVKLLEGLMDKNLVLKMLPIEVDYFTEGYAERVRYTISYKVFEDYSGFKIIITDYTGGNYERAVRELEERGVEYEKYNLEYVDKTGDKMNGRAK